MVFMLPRYYNQPYAVSLHKSFNYDEVFRVDTMKHSSNFIKQATLMFLAVAIFNILSLLYQIYMVRNLSPQDYGILNSLFSILVIISIPSGTLQMVVTKFVSTSHASNHYEKINHLLRSFTKKTSVFGLIIFLTFLFASGATSSFLHISSPLLIVMLGAVAFFSIILPLAQGVLQGLQKFAYLGSTMIANSGLKLILGIIFVQVGYGVMGAMSALAISIVATIILVFIILASVLPKTSTSSPDVSPLEPNNTNTEINFTEIHSYFYAVTIVLLCFMILTNIDVVLVKHYFQPMEAGYYSIAQMVGKIILFLPVAITLVMFPLTSELHAQTKETSHLLKKSLLYVGVLCGTAALICVVFPNLIIKLLAGRGHLRCIPLSRFFAVTMFFYAMVYVFLFYHLSIQQFGFIYSLVLLTVLQVLAITLFH